MFTTRRQDDYAELLPLAEFAYNNSTHSTTGYSPFYATYGYHPALSFATPTSSTVPAAEERIKHLQEVHAEVKTMIDLAGLRAQRYYNEGVLLQPNFDVGDKVFLRRENISTTAPSKKLASKFLGPFPIIARLSEVVYKLKLPRTLRIHNVFHVSLLHRYKEDTIEGRRVQRPPPIVTPDGDVQ